jgi:hypothetical protein
LSSPPSNPTDPPVSLGPAPQQPVARQSGGTKRGLWIGVAALLGFCILGCLLVFVAGIPAFRNEVRDGVHDAVATEVARQIPAPSGTVEPGTYVLDAASLESSLRQTLDDQDEAVIVRITNVQIEVGVTSQGQDAIYTGVPAAEDGELVVNDMQTDNGFVSFILPPGTIAGAIEDAVNDFLAANNVRLDALELGDGVMTLTLSAR